MIKFIIYVHHMPIIMIKCWHFLKLHSVILNMYLICWEMIGINENWIDINPRGFTIREPGLLHVFVRVPGQLDPFTDPIKKHPLISSHELRPPTRFPRQFQASKSAVAMESRSDNPQHRDEGCQQQKIVETFYAQ